MAILPGGYRGRLRRAYWAAGLVASMALTGLVIGAGLVPTAPVEATPALAPDVNPTVESVAGQTQATDAPRPTKSPAERPTPTNSPPTLTANPVEMTEPYHIDAVQPPGGLGIQRLYIANIGWPVQQTPVDPLDLRLPSGHLRPDTGRFAEIRGTYRLTHLGSDYLNPNEDWLAPPADNSILAATVYLQRSTYVAIAIDMSGNIQMYLATLQTDEGPRMYLIAYAHFRSGSNEQAIDQALADEGRVETMGRVDIVSADNPNLSDMHIGVIDVMDLLSFTHQNNIHDALVELFSDRLPRTNQQYPDIFERPESVFPALQGLLEVYDMVERTPEASP